MTTRSTYTDPQTKEYWLRVRAALKFCDGYSTEQLEGRTLGDVVAAIEGAECGYTISEVLVNYRRIRRDILSHFRQEQPDDKDS